ncbi:hypothetical protein L9F63_021964 [Diploptera punctata]|uniref:Uncharacterized protein n=1 Tax=Diploptera punctata TaxID=6984 RepID=A0AAD8EBI1_DIPPU|nr:hypothetical protein L9F63_021964 [Diploptera punctata]
MKSGYTTKWRHKLNRDPANHCMRARSSSGVLYSTSATTRPSTVCATCPSEADTGLRGSSGGLLCMLAFCGTTYLFLLNWNRFVTSPTVTVIETTNFPIANIPFPSVAFCDINRVLWSKAMEFQNEHFSDASNETIELFHTLLQSMSLLEFGDFDVISQDISFANSPEIKALNISELMLRVMPSLDEMFYLHINSCWWRNDFYNSLGKARIWFDSSADYLKLPHKDKANFMLRPYRSSNYGPWGGLRFSLKTSNDSSPKSPVPSGIIMIISNPQDFPENGRVIPSGNTVTVDIDAYVTYTKDRVRSLRLEDRKCLYVDEGNSMNLGGYLMRNCLVECHRNYTLKYCNCTPYFFYSHRDNVPACNITGYICLSKNNDAFNYHKADSTNRYFEKTSAGMECPCQADCSYPLYSLAVSMSRTMKMPDDDDDDDDDDEEDDNQEEDEEEEEEEDEENEGDIFFDIHFQNPTMVRYRTDVQYSWLDLVVAFGGIAGLCLGCSLLSGAEVIYYFTLRLYRHYRLVYGTTSIHTRKTKQKILKRPANRSVFHINPEAFHLHY